MIGAEHRNPRRRGRSRLPRLVALALCLAAIVQVAVYDTVIAIGGGARPYAAHPKPTRPASVAAAVAAAAHDVLVTRVPGLAAGVDTRYADYLAAIPDGPPRPTACPRRPRRRGHPGPAGRRRLRQPGPLGPAGPRPGRVRTRRPTPPVDVALAQVRPLTFGSPSRFRPGGPTRLASHAHARDLAEVQALGRADSTVRSPAQTEVARFWSENTFVQWGRNLSAHGCWTTALVHTLGVFFGTDRVRLTVDSTVAGTSRHYRSLREVVREVRLARMAGGLHFRHSMGDGEHLGRRVARHVTRHHFQRR